MADKIKFGVDKATPNGAISVIPEITQEEKK